jgi:tripartite-type tricarboxylate transporter receptor subunit TctC
MKRRHALGYMACALGALAAGSGASAQEYPSRQIRILSPYGPGGGNDTIARLLATKLGEAFDQRVLVENKPGGNTILANDILAKSPPDGHTLILNGNGFVTNPSFHAKMPFDTVRDIAPVAFIAFTELVLVSNVDVPANNVKELIALARAKPATLNFGNSGFGGPEHLAGVMFGQLTGADIGSVPYKGAAAAITDMIGGQVQLMITALAAVKPYLESGKLKLIAMANDTRSPQYPDVPTVAEAGLPEFQTSLWYGLMAPAGTPEPVVRRLNQEINRILQDKEVTALFSKRGLAPGRPDVYGTPELFGKFIRSELASVARVARAADIKPE